MTDQTQAEALRALIEKVEAGAFDAEPGGAFMPRYHGLTKLMGDALGAMPQVGLHDLAWRAYEGSLDAAKALHDALLPDRFPWSIGEEAGRLQGDPSRWVVGIFSYDADKTIAWEVNEVAARAWLLSILKAKLAEVEA